MPCYSPLHGYRSRFPNSNGKYYFTMSLKDGYKDRPMDVPCGQCIGCRLERSRVWAVRCVHEASLHSQNCFITLTFNDEHLNIDRNLDKKDFVLFMKRLRKSIEPKKVRFFHCGEYGDKSMRPHHHACLFGYDFPDKELWTTRDGIKLYRSAQLEKLWPYGFCTIGDVTFESAAYVARYVTKKQTLSVASKNKDVRKYLEKYAYGIDYETGEVLCREQEYVTMSRGGRYKDGMGGIGKQWLMKYSKDVYPDDFVLVRDNIKVKPPKYYDNIFDVEFGDIDPVKSSRRKKADARKEDNSFERLLVREECKMLKVKKLIRSIEND